MNKQAIHWAYLEYANDKNILDFKLDRGDLTRDEYRREMRKARDLFLIRTNSIPGKPSTQPKELNNANVII